MMARVLLLAAAAVAVRAEDCPGDLVWQDCGTVCEPICGNEAPTFCALVCISDCQCPTGHWRHDKTASVCHADVSGCEADTVEEEEEEEAATLVGGDRDENDCCASCGYSWCESSGKCVRTWEEEGCLDATAAPTAGAGAAPALIGGPEADHGCVTGGGYSWCDSLGACLRPWEKKCPETGDLDASPEEEDGDDDEADGAAVYGGDRDANDCCISCGYSWCESSGKCVRAWEEVCADASSSAADASSSSGGGDDDAAAAAATVAAAVAAVALVFGAAVAFFVKGKYGPVLCKHDEKESLVQLPVKAAPFTDAVAEGTDIVVAGAEGGTDIV